MNLLSDFWQWATWGIHVKLGPLMCFVFAIVYVWYVTRPSEKQRAPQAPRWRVDA